VGCIIATHESNFRQAHPIHIQIRLKKRPNREHGNVSGSIQRIFRDDTGRLVIGQAISFEVNWTDGRSDTDSEPTLRRQRFALDVEWLKTARVLEVYLTVADSRYLVLWDQATALMHRTRYPVNPIHADGYGIFVDDAVLRRIEHQRQGLSHWWHRRMASTARV
jgi:hypothetical protein